MEPPSFCNAPFKEGCIVANDATCLDLATARHCLRSAERDSPPVRDDGRFPSGNLEEFDRQGGRMWDDAADACMQSQSRDVHRGADAHLILVWEA